MLDDAVGRWADEPAVIDDEGPITYAQLSALARDFSAALVSSGVRTGDRVAIWAPNTRRWIIAALGTFSAGAVAVPVNTRFKGAEAAQILRASGARVLVTACRFLNTDYVAMLRGSGVDLPDLEIVVATDVAAQPGTLGWDDFLSRPDRQAYDEADRRRSGLNIDDASDIIFTSGTTGSPKGAVSTHRRCLTMAVDWIDMTGLHQGDRYLQINPYFHIFGLQCGILTSIAAGAVMLPEPVFEVDRVLEAVARERVTILPGAPTLYQSILDHPHVDKYDLSTLRVALTGSADIPVELIRRIHEDLPFSRIIAAYGMTETGTACATRSGDDLQHIASTVGFPRPGCEIRIVDVAGHDVHLGESGEILIKSPSLMSHYLNDAEATAAAVSADGWMRTGDAGLLDESGRLRIVGRIKDMFSVGGFNAYPAEIENILRRHPDIQDVAVIGIADHRLGEVGMAFVVLRPGSGATDVGIISWSRDQMANYKVPRVVQIVDDLPRNATGKVQKHVLRARAGE
jgi:acyl-CoA synthetase (AMP-forming)/AMP-acid ligase II